MVGEKLKEEFNRVLIGKTIYWKNGDGEDQGECIDVKDAYTILVRGVDKSLNEVDLFDIYETKEKIE